MKNIKSILTGFLLATSLFLFMGQTSNNNNNNNGRFQFENYALQGYTTKFYEIIFDTQTGKVIKRSWIDESEFNKD